MIATGRFAFLISLLTSLSITLTVGSTTSTEAYGQNLLLRELAKEDQDSRSDKKIARTDEERVKIVLAQIAQRTLKVPEDDFNAALVLQHTGFTFCEKRLISVSPDNYLLAHYLFQSAFEAGYKDARF